MLKQFSAGNSFKNLLMQKRLSILNPAQCWGRALPQDWGGGGGGGVGVGPYF